MSPLSLSLIIRYLWGMKMVANDFKICQLQRLTRATTPHWIKIQNTQKGLKEEKIQPYF